MKDIRIAAGGEVLSLSPADGMKRPSVGELYHPFLSDDLPTFGLLVHNGPGPQIDIGHTVFQVGGVWSCQCSGKASIIRFLDRGHPLHQVVLFEQDQRAGDLFCAGGMWERDPDYPVLDSRVGEVLFQFILAERRGVLFHALGLVDEGQAWLFAGPSGAGKTTLARLWQRHASATVLSDDRIIVRKQGGQYRAFGTPWHGDARLASAESAPISGIFMIRHAAQNAVRVLKPLEAIMLFLERFFPRDWDQKAMAFTMEFLDDLVHAVPCYELSFVPDGSAVDFVRCTFSK